MLFFFYKYLLSFFFISEFFSATEVTKARLEWQWNSPFASRYSELRKSRGTGCIQEWWVIFLLLFLIIFIIILFNHFAILWLGIIIENLIFIVSIDVNIFLDAFFLSFFLFSFSYDWYKQLLSTASNKTRVYVDNCQ